MNEKIEEKLKAGVGKRTKVKIEEGTFTVTNIGFVLCEKESNGYLLGARVFKQELWDNTVEYVLEPTYFKGNREIKQIGVTPVRPRFSPEFFDEISTKAKLIIERYKQEQ